MFITSTKAKIFLLTHRVKICISIQYFHKYLIINYLETYQLSVIDYQLERAQK